MKKSLVSLSLLGIVALGAITLSTSSANADTVVGQTKSTPVTVGITDDTSDPDPLDPTKPAQQLLVLNTVPTSYDFTSTLQNGSYSLTTSTLEKQNVTVFNSRAARAWSVKATVTNTKLSKGSNEFPVTSFTINGTELVATGATGIVAKNADTTTENNTGTISTPVTSAGIKFTDSTGVLKAGDKITGTIAYQLYNTATAS